MEWTISLEGVFNHALIWWFLLVAFIVIAEIIYFVMVKTESRARNQSWWNYTSEGKGQSALLAAMGIGVLCIVVYMFPILLCVSGIVGLIWFWLWINKKVAEKFGSIETKAEEKERKRKEKKEVEDERKKVGCPFRVGDIITGKPNNGYRKFTDQAKIKVLKIEKYGDDNMKGEIISHKSIKSSVGNVEWLESGGFVKVKKGKKK